MSFLNVVKREVKTAYNQLIMWIVAVILPLVFCGLICIIFSSGSPKDLPIAILNQDNSKLSRLFVRNIDATQSCHVKYKVTDFLEGKKLLSQGSAYALVVIPKNFQSDIYRLKQPSIVLYYNNQTILIGGIVSKDIKTVLQSMLVGIDAKTRSKRGLPLDIAIKRANLIVVDDHIRSNPYLNYQYFLSLISFGHILQICLIFTPLWAIGREFKYGTAKKWLESADDSILIAVLGKIFPYFILFIIIFAIIYFTYFGILEAPFSGNLLFVILSTLVFIATCMTLSILFMSLNGNFRYALSGAAFYSAMGFAFAGITYPIIAMPLIARIYSQFLPLTHYIKIMLNQTIREIPVFYDYGSFFSMIVLMIVSLAFLPRLKTLAKDESKWYQL